MLNPILEAIMYLTTLAFGLVTFLFMARFILQLVGADFYNLIAQFITKWTEPALKPFRFFPSSRKVNVVCLVVMLAIQWLKLFLLASLAGFSIQPVGFLISGTGKLLQIFLDIYFYAILIRVIVSWMMPQSYNPTLSLLYQITDPVLNWVRRIVPPLGIIDLSPVVVLIAIQLLHILLVKPISGIGVF